MWFYNIIVIKDSNFLAHFEIEMFDYSLIVIAINIKFDGMCFTYRWFNNSIH